MSWSSSCPRCGTPPWRRRGPGGARGRGRWNSRDPAPVRHLPFAICHHSGPPFWATIWAMVATIWAVVATIWLQKKCPHPGRTDGWMDGRMDGWMDGWMELPSIIPGRMGGPGAPRGGVTPAALPRAGSRESRPQRNRPRRAAHCPCGSRPSQPMRWMECALQPGPLARGCSRPLERGFPSRSSSLAGNPPRAGGGPGAWGRKGGHGAPRPPSPLLRPLHRSSRGV